MAGLLHFLRRVAHMPVLNGMLLVSFPFTLAEPVPGSHALQGEIPDAQQQQRQQTRERVLQQQNTAQSEVRLAPSEVVLPDYPGNEPSCFIVNTLRLIGIPDARFRWALNAADVAQGHCLGGPVILLLINQVQNVILAEGYAITRVMARKQSLTKGVLTQTIQPDRIGDIRFDRLWNAIPTSSGEMLNLRATEQGTENVKRLPGATADIKIVRGQRDATSDLRVSWQQGNPARLSLGLDDSGSKSTGRYLGSATLALDAPFAHNDLFYANLGEDLPGRGPCGNRFHTLYYFFPVGYWGFSANYNHYNWYQNIAGTNQMLTYRGKSGNVQLTLSRLLYRNQLHKTTLIMRAWRRHSSIAVNDIDIEQRRRRTAGWELGFSQRSYIGAATLDVNLNWRRGTAASGALRSPEENTHSGSARTGIALGDISLNQPLAFGEQTWRFVTSVRGQWSRQALTPPDRMAIAGRYTVRGFDGERMLSGERAVIWRNELAWNVLSRGHELYAAADYGRVADPGPHSLARHQLVGSALGVRGALWQRLSYDLFAGVPLVKPRSFHTSGATAGFSLNLEI